MTNAWKTRLETKLRSLSDTASKETVQTMARWISFNRKHSSIVAAVFATSLGSASSEARQWLCWQILHEILTQKMGWEKSADLRTMLGETSILPAVALPKVKALKGRLEPLMDDWDANNSFGGPTLITQIRKCLNETPSAAAAKKPASKSAGRSRADAQSVASPQNSASKAQQGASPASAAATSTTSTATATEAATATATSMEAEQDRDGEMIPMADDNELESASDAKDTRTSEGAKGTESASTSSRPASSAASTNDGSGKGAGSDAGSSSGIATPGTQAATKATSKQPSSSSSSTSNQPERRGSLSSVTQVEYNFEEKNIPIGKVNAREFLDPCKAIATLQIARDLRNDAAVQLSSLLTTMPEELTELLKEKKDNVIDADGDQQDDKGPLTDDKGPLTDDKARNFSIIMKEELVDMDLEDQLLNVRTFRDIVQRQFEARKQLIYLLIRSRCKFGADESAESFYALDGTIERLKKRKDAIFDSMELEGLDFEAKKLEEDNAGTAADLPELTWYKQNGKDEDKGEQEGKGDGTGQADGDATAATSDAGDAPQSKKQRVEA